MAQKTVKITCTGADVVELNELSAFQGDLKELSEENYQRLKASILDLGISFPFNIWKEKSKKWIIDAHQRAVTLARMRDEDGYAIPKVPVVWVKAKDQREAAKKVLAATSQFGVITPDGLHGFMSAHEIDIDFVQQHCHFPEVNIEAFADAYYAQEKEVSFKTKPGSKELASTEFEQFGHTCPKCGFGFD